jgi:hypothetical protein
VTEHGQPTNADDIAVAEKKPTGTEVLRAAGSGQMTGVRGLMWLVQGLVAYVRAPK